MPAGGHPGGRRVGGGGARVRRPRPGRGAGDHAGRGPGRVGARRVRSTTSSPTCRRRGSPAGSSTCRSVTSTPSWPGWPAAATRGACSSRPTDAAGGPVGPAAPTGTGLPGHRAPRRRPDRRTPRWSPTTVADAGEDAARLFGRRVSGTLVEADAVTTRVLAGAEAADRRRWPGRRGAARGGRPARLAHRRRLRRAHRDRRDRRPWRRWTRSWWSATTWSSPARRSKRRSPARWATSARSGSRRTQQARADWLAYRGVTDLDRVHGPAGLDIGATTPPEIAVSILAEAHGGGCADVRASAAGDDPGG